MKVSDSAPRSQTAEDRFAQRIVARLNEDALDHAVAERLRAARVRAVAARKRTSVHGAAPWVYRNVTDNAVFLDLEWGGSSGHCGDVGPHALGP